MKILDALEETGKAEHPDKPGKYVELKDDFLGWYHTITEIGAERFAHSWYFKQGFKPYREAGEIRPEEGGELWSFENELDGADYIFVMEGEEAGELRCADSTGESTGRIPVKMIHNKNGWKLIYSPDKEIMAKINGEDDSVETIEIENVTWHSDPCMKGVVHPEMDNGLSMSLLYMPPMKMILKIPKI